jgi:hypothetical protein
MRDNSNCDKDGRHGRRSNDLSQAEPVPRPLETTRFMPNFSQDIPSKKWRKRRLGKPAENVPQFFVILRFHVVHPIQQSAWLEVALERGPKLGSNSRRFKKTFQLSNPGRMPHFAQRLCLDLADPLASDLELPSYFF